VGVRFPLTGLIAFTLVGTGCLRAAPGRENKDLEASIFGPPASGIHCTRRSQDTASYGEPAAHGTITSFCGPRASVPASRGGSCSRSEMVR
jgi:hypothetical protein